MDYSHIAFYIPEPLNSQALCQWNQSHILSKYDNTDLKKDFKLHLKNLIINSDKQLVLNIFQINNDLASNTYIQKKKILGEEIGVKVNHYNFESGDINRIKDKVDYAISSREGIIFQLPIPLKLNSLIDSVKYCSDVDMLGLESEKLWKNNFLPPNNRSY